MIRTALLALTTLTLPAAAQTVPDQDAAKRLLFDTRGAQVAVLRHGFMSDADVTTLQALPEVAQLKYYGAMAAHPDEGIQAERTRGAFNFHSIDQARAAALSGCGSGCVVIAEILPRRYEAGRALTLNQDASKVVTGRDFTRAGTDAALAISPSTGGWGIGNGEQAAVATCAAAGARDCAVAVGR
ncbi:hypothetical protein [Jannaschia donghaensis]|uniref:DUF4189 domain-containing protein n=1 Tax=Jannaschia donghaensis TaxID=420998 RepID=A0A0M6YKQ3_9RHOB|nr:hypothetical protein [Jannaschia donghaensis]CTQ50948.1 hypothetical protein JDO7802_02979 [Jannaschia donghaensis]